MSSEHTSHTSSDSCRIPLPREESTNESWFAGMDGLDKLSIVCLILLVGTSLFLILSFDPEAEVNVARVSKKVAIQQQFKNPELANKIKIAKNLLAANNLGQGSQMVAGMIKDYPFNGKPYMLMGDIYLRKQMPVEAMYEFKKGVDLNPDFLDKKTDLFQGKKIKNTMAEVKDLIEKGLGLNPGDKSLIDHRKTLYYMQRKVAGSCS